jgi:hypothetical protein
VSHIFDREPIMYFPDTGEMHRMNPIPERAKKARLTVVEGENNLLQTGLKRLDWSAVKRVSPSKVREFLDAYKITGDLPGTILAGNYKTNKPRVETGRQGKIVGLNLMPHFYPNILNLPQMDPLAWNFQEVEDEEGEEAIEEGDSPDASPELRTAKKKKEEIRRLFNSFNGKTQKTAAKSADVPENMLLNFCAGSSEYCRSTCLILTGNHTAAFETSQKKLKLTNAFLSEPVMFVAALNQALKIFACACEGSDLDPVVRLNMLSDIPWYSLCPELFEEHESISFYDYTKLLFWRSEDYQRIANGVGNLDLTFSYSGANEKQCEEALQNGYRVAAVFASADPNRLGASGGASRTTFKEVVGTSGLIDSKGLMEIFGGKWLAIDGDESDYRIDDPAQSIVCLNFKAPNVKLKWEPADQKKLDKLLQKQATEGLTEKEEEKLEDLFRQQTDVQAYSGLAEALPEARLMFSTVEGPEGERVGLVKKSDKGRAISATVNNKRLWKLAKKQNKSITPSAFSPEQLFELSKLKFPENVERALEWFSQMKAADEALEKGVAMQYVTPTEEGARANGTGLLIGPHIPVVVND